MWEVLSFADKPYKGLSKAKVNNSTWGFTNCDRCGWAKQEQAWFCCDDGCLKSDGWTAVIFCAR